MEYNPLFQINSQIIKYLGKIEAAREIVDDFAIPVALEQIFRKEATAKISHYSTKIEGNRLTLKQTKNLLNGIDVIARDIDKKEVLNYYNCLEWINKNCKTKQPIQENDIKQMHAIIQKGIVEGKLKGYYRLAQNAVYDAKTNEIIYLPCEVKDIIPLMQGLINYLNKQEDIHPIIKAAIAHYQLVTIHPFMDGNGRTARALATFILYREKYDLKQLYSLEEYYAQDLAGYYAALHQCQGTNYYDNPNPDITNWLEYFIKGVAITFETIKENVIASAKKQNISQNKEDLKILETIGPREKKLLAFFHKHLQLKTKDLCLIFRIKERTARDLIAKLLKQGFIQRHGTGKRDAYYILSAGYRRVIGGIE